jgi:hypothetical protein
MVFHCGMAIFLIFSLVYNRHVGLRCEQRTIQLDATYHEVVVTAAVDIRLNYHKLSAGWCRHAARASSSRSAGDVFSRRLREGS